MGGLAPAPAGRGSPRPAGPLVRRSRLVGGSVPRRADPRPRGPKRVDRATARNSLASVRAYPGAAGASASLNRWTMCSTSEQLLRGRRAGRAFCAAAALFPELDFWVPAGEGVLVPTTPEALAGDSHQTWAWDPAAGRWRFDVFREPHDGDVWICRRDEQRIRRP